MKKEEKNKVELNPYQTDKFSKIPSWFKILLLKLWAAAAAFYFFSIASYFIHQGIETIHYVWVSLGLGLILNIIVNNIVRFMRNSRDNTFNYNMVNLRGIPGLLLTFLYSYFIMIPLVGLYTLVLAPNGIYIHVFGSDTFGFEPITASFVFVILDAAMIAIKRLSIYIYKKIKFHIDEKKAIELENKLKEGK